MRTNTFLYRKNCRLCYLALQDILPVFGRLEIPLIVQPISGEYVKQIDYVPALVLRTSAFNTDQELVLIGRDMVQQLQVLEAATLKLDNQ